MTKKIKVLKYIVFISIFYYLFSSIYVKKSISKDDLFISKLLNVDKECTNIKTFEEEIKCIKSVQESQLKLIKGTDCRGKFINLGSKKILEKNTACCFDRARITEQTLQLYGFKVRHIFLFPTQKRGYFNLLKPEVMSHATTEVLTSKGWLGVDSNEDFILLDKDEVPYTYKNGLKKGLVNNLASNTDVYDSPLIYLIGLYSRNGTFFKPYLPFVPEINFYDFFSNIPKIEIVSEKEYN